MQIFPHGVCILIFVVKELKKYEINYQHILLGRSNQVKCGGRDMWHAWERRRKCTRFR